MAWCVTSLVFLFAVSASANITDLMQSCAADEDERCHFTDQDYELFHSPEYKVRLFTLLSSGIPFILWTEIGTGKSFDNVSPECIADLEYWKRKMLSGDKQGLKMIDSSGKYPTASMMHTTTALGDYDQCLSINEAQFCSLELFPKQIDRSVWTSGNHSLDQSVMNQDTGLIQTICLPASACSPIEIRRLVDQIVQPYLMTAGPGFVSCDTAQSISWAETLKSLSTYQKICLAYLLITMWLISCATGLHVIFLVTGYQPSGLLKSIASFSAIESAVKVFYVKESYFDDPRRIILDIFKAISICITAISHSIAVFGAPLAFYLFDSQKILVDFVKQPSSQASSNEAGIGVFMVLSGFTVFQIMYPMAKAKKLPYFLAFIDRMVKFLPAMAAVVAIEMSWPVLGSGPLYTHYTGFNLKRCGENGWANLLLVNNWMGCMDICAPQTFFASLVTQLFLISLIVTKVLVKNEKAGIQMCWLLIITSNLWTGYNAWHYNITPTLFNAYPKAQDIVDHITAVHAHFSSGCTTFFVGFLTGFYIFEKKMVLDLSSWTTTIKWFMVSTTLTSIGTGLMIASVSLDLVDRRFSPVFVLANRGCMAASTVVLLFVLYSLKDFSIFRKIIGGRQNTGTETERKELSFLAAFHRLALGIFFTNMTVVQYDVFTRRRLITYELIPIISRSIFTLISVLVASFFFTVFFIIPFEKMVSLLLSQRERPKSKKNR